jgi:hypothetical protein
MKKGSRLKHTNLGQGKQFSWVMGYWGKQSSESYCITILFWGKKKNQCVNLTDIYGTSTRNSNTKKQKQNFMVWGKNPPQMKSLTFPCMAQIICQHGNMSPQYGVTCRHDAT